MPHKSQITQHESLIASLKLKEAHGFRFSGDETFEVQSAPYAEPTAYSEVFGSILEDTQEHSALESWKQAPVRFDPLMLQGVDLLAALRPSTVKVNSFSQSLVAVVDTLVEIVSEDEEHLMASLTTEDHQRLATARDKLIEVVGANENHFLIPLIDFITNLTRIREEESNPSIEKQHHSARRRKRETSVSNRQRVKLADLLPQEIEDAENNENVNASSFKPRRPEHMGRPANRPRVKLTDLLSRETEYIAAREVDTEIEVDVEE
ncbi:MAG: hypothetical protein OXI61_17220 [Candidatus Poribacteria bacterium]|nr:hypothetical protein [Candidatus Poribacteria bacterium]